MRNNWGQFTVRGSAEFDAWIASLLEEVGVAVQKRIPAQKYRALLLIGGYGRGEGGVEILDGVARPHNNLDFLLLTESLGEAEASEIQNVLNLDLAALEKLHDVRLDLSFMPVKKLLNSPCLVMWYDMRFGHKTVVGDPDFVPSLKQFTVERILPSDILWLLVNRGSQILVSDLLIRRGEPSEDERRYIVMLTMKAVVAYGDALLYFLGLYDWSYREKAQRMAKAAAIGDEFKKLYADAVEFRFQPDYGPYLKKDLQVWSDAIRNSLEEIHILCETRHLDARGWTWAEYPSLCMQQAIFEAPLSPSANVKKLLNLVRGPNPPSHLKGLDRLACRMAGPKQLLLACYPAVAYNQENETLLRWTQQSLGAVDTSLEELRVAFLSMWGRLIDPDFFKVVKRFDLFANSEENVT